MDLVIPFFKATHVDEAGDPLQGLFLFDNSKCHDIMAPDALVVSLMNVFPGGNQPRMRDGWYMKDGMRIAQTMCFSAGDTVLVDYKERNGENKGKAVAAGTKVESAPWLLGTPKGMKQVKLM